MKLARLTIRRGATVNIGNYESARVEVEMTAEPDKKGDIDYDKLDSCVKANLQAALSELEHKHVPKKERFVGTGVPLPGTVIEDLGTKVEVAVGGRDGWYPLR